MPEKYLDKNGLSHLWSKIPKEQVWVGSEEPTGDQTVWIDPTGSETAGLVTQAELANKQDKLTAGTNITIDSNNVISATGGSGGSYTLPVANRYTLGGVKIESNGHTTELGRYVLMDEENKLYVPIPNGLNDPGVISVSWENFSLTRDSYGRQCVLSLNKPEMINKYLGGVCPDGTTITMTDKGIISASAPTATTSTLGLVKPDGTSITIADGVISSTQPTKTSELTNDSGFITNEYHDPDKQNKLVAGDNITIADDGTISASHPAQYIKNANATENTLNLYFNDGASINFTPTGGSGGGSGGVSGYAFSSTQTLTDADKAHLKEIYINKNIYMTIDGLAVVRIMSLGAKRGFIVINTNGATSNQVSVYTVDLDGSGNVTSNTFTLFMSYYLAGNSSALSGDIITSATWSHYISAGGGDWQYTSSSSESNLYNAKEMVLYWTDNYQHKHQTYLNFTADFNFNTGLTLGTGWLYADIYLDADDSISHPSIQYNGSQILANNCIIYFILYKT